MRYWLLKTEPKDFSISDLEKEGSTFWDGVRNYQARNFLREMKAGDKVLIYHSSIAEPAVVGEGEIVGEVMPDQSQFDKKSPYFDQASAKRLREGRDVRWVTREVAFRGILRRPTSLSFIKRHPELQKMLVAQRGNRLSIQPVEKSHFNLILSLGSGVH